MARAGEHTMPLGVAHNGHTMGEHTMGTQWGSTQWQGRGSTQCPWGEHTMGTDGKGRTGTGSEVEPFRKAKVDRVSLLLQ